MAKKDALENLLKTQQSLEEVEESIAGFISKETIEVAHTRFCLRSILPIQKHFIFLQQDDWLFVLFRLA